MVIDTGELKRQVRILAEKRTEVVCRWAAGAGSERISADRQENLVRIERIEKLALELDEFASEDPVILDETLMRMGWEPKRES